MQSMGRLQCALTGVLPTDRRLQAPHKRPSGLAPEPQEMTPAAQHPSNPHQGAEQKHTQAGPGAGERRCYSLSPANPLLKSPP